MNEKLCYYAEGDCCSSSWYEHISGAENLAGTVVFGVEDVDMADVVVDNEDEFECLALYGIKIITTRGYVDIDFRNESNGYYGGYIVKVDDVDSKEDLRVLKEDI